MCRLSYHVTLTQSRSVNRWQVVLLGRLCILELALPLAAMADDGVQTCSMVRFILTDVLSLIGNVTDPSSQLPPGFFDMPLWSGLKLAALLSFIAVFIVAMLALLLCRARTARPIKPDSELLPVSADQRFVDERVSPMNISFEKLGLRLANGQQVLCNVNGTLHSGQCCAVMGPSGSGKSTFLSAISGRVTYGKVLGRVFINGEADSLAQHKFITGFVPQEDVMIRELTVEQTLVFAAQARLDRSLSRAQIKHVVQQVIADLHLEGVASSAIGDENVRVRAVRVGGNAYVLNAHFSSCG